MAKIYAWAVIKVLQICPKSIKAFVSEVEVRKDEETCKLPTLLEQTVSFGCKEMPGCEILPSVDLEKYPVRFERPEPDQKIVFRPHKEYGVLIVAQGTGSRAQRIIKGNTKDVLYKALGRDPTPEIGKPGLKSYQPRTTSRRAI